MKKVNIGGKEYYFDDTSQMKQDLVELNHNINSLDIDYKKYIHFNYEEVILDILEMIVYGKYKIRVAQHNLVYIENYINGVVIPTLANIKMSNVYIPAIELKPHDSDPTNIIVEYKI